MAHIPDTLLNLSKITSEHCDVTFATREHLTREPHTHPTPIYVMVTEGTMFVASGGEEKAFHAGDWCAIDAGVEHAERFAEKTSTVVFWVKAA